MKKILTYLLFLLFVSGQVFGQTELEIKTTGKYYYSWAIEESREKAIDVARSGLLDTIFISLLKETSIDDNDTIFVSVIDYFDQEMGFKWQAIAFAKKTDIKVKMQERKRIEVIPIVVEEESSIYNLEKRGDEVEITPDSSILDMEHKEISASSEFIGTGSEIIDSLILFEDSKLLGAELRRLQSELVLNYGVKANYPDDSECYLFIIDRSSKKVVAVFDKGKGARRNLYNNEVEKNIDQKFPNSIQIYVALN